MPCFHPVTGYRSRVRSANGKWPVVFDVSQGYKDKPVIVPCGRCLGCRMEKVRQWALRMHHEAMMHEKSCFLTLTYDKEHLAEDGSLNKRDIVLFLKRLRKEFLYESDKGHYKINFSPLKTKTIRYFQCGEYGDAGGRPHHHVIIFGFEFPDKEPIRLLGRSRIFKSEKLKSLWPYGYSSIGAVTFQSCAYVARYVTKKINGKDRDSHYGTKLPEYATMSRRPGIGANFYERYKKDIYVKDRCIVKNNLQCTPPKYYDNKYEKENPWRLEKLKERRIANVDKERYTPEALEQAEKAFKLRFKKYHRTMEKESDQFYDN